MSRNSRPFTTRRTMLGVPIGRRHTDWAAVRKAAIAGAGALSTAAGGVRVVRRGVPKVVRDLPGQVAGTATSATGQLRKATGQLAGAASGRLGQIAPASLKNRTDTNGAGPLQAERTGSDTGQNGNARRATAGKTGTRTQRSTSKQGSASKPKSASKQTKGASQTTRAPRS